MLVLSRERVQRAERHQYVRISWVDREGASEGRRARHALLPVPGPETTHHPAPRQHAVRHQAVRVELHTLERQRLRLVESFVEMFRPGEPEVRLAELRIDLRRAAKVRDAARARIPGSLSLAECHAHRTECRVCLGMIRCELQCTLGVAYGSVETLTRERVEALSCPRAQHLRREAGGIPRGALSVRRWSGGPTAGVASVSLVQGDQLRELRVRLDEQLRPHERLMSPRLPDRPRPVAARGERTHQLERDAPVQRIDLGQPLPPSRGIGMLSRRSGRQRQRAERPRVDVRQPRALDLDPALEVGGTAEEDAVEEGAGVELRHPLGIAGPMRSLEILDVARHVARVEPQDPRPDHDLAEAEIVSEPVQRLAERVQRRALVLLGPEVADELLAAQPPLAGDREAREQAQSLGTYVPRRQGPSRRLDRQPAQCQHPEHRQRTSRRVPTPPRYGSRTLAQGSGDGTVIRR